MKLKFFSAAFILFAAINGALTAQAQDHPTEALDTPVTESNTQRSTAGRFSTGVDNIVKTTEWGSVIPEGQLFGFAGYGNAVRTDWRTGLFNAGFAGKTDKLYVGGIYTGNMAKLDDAESKNLTVVYQQGAAGYEELNRTETDAAASGHITASQNALGLLFGVGTMGFKVFAYENLTTQNANVSGASYISQITKIVGGSTTTDEYSDEYKIYGNVTPLIGWGMNKTLNDDKGSYIKPWVDLGVNIDYGYYNNASDNDVTYKYTRTQRTVPLDADPTQDVVTEFSNKAGFIAPIAKLGVEYGLKKDETSAMALILEYKFGANIYGSNYGSNTKKTLKEYDINGNYVETTTTEEKNYTDRFTMENVIIPKFDYTRTLSDNLTLQTRAQIGITIGSDSTKNNYSKSQVVYTDYSVSGGESRNNTATTTWTGYDDNASTLKTNADTSSFTLDPKVYVGAQFIATEKFTWNAGAIFSIPAYTNTTTKTTPVTNGKKVTETVYADGSIIEPTVTETTPNITGSGLTDTTSTTNTVSAFSATLCAGFSFAFTPNFGVDAGLSTTAGTWGISLDSIGVLFTFQK